VESFWVLRATVACEALLGRAFPMLPHAGGLSVDALRIEAGLPGAGPVRRLPGRFGDDSPGSGDRSRDPNLALAVDWDPKMSFGVCCTMNGGRDTYICNRHQTTACCNGILRRLLSSGFGIRGLDGDLIRAPVRKAHFTLAIRII